MKSKEERKLELEADMAQFNDAMELSNKKHLEILELHREMKGDNHKRLKVSQQAVIQNNDGEILILHEPIQGNWLLPGGRIEDTDTSAEQSLGREIQEELGLSVVIGKTIGVDMSHSGLTYAVALSCSIPNDSVIRLSKEHDEYKWVLPTEVEKYLYYKNIALAIAKRLA